MGSSCSMHQRQQQYEQSFRDHQLRRRRINIQNRRNHTLCQPASKSMSSRRSTCSTVSGNQSSLRYTVTATIPDSTIPSLYTAEDNFERLVNNRRSPKSLSELACNAVCRSLPNLKGAFPPDLPQDVVDDLFNSLIRHSALTASTLKMFQNCELRSLSLSNSRGVTDSWLTPLSTIKRPILCSGNLTPNSNRCVVMRDLQPILLSNPITITGHDLNLHNRIDSMDTDDSLDNHTVEEIFYGTYDTIPMKSSNEECSCSTSSYLSAASNHNTCQGEISFNVTNSNMISSSPCSDGYAYKKALNDEERRPSMDETEVSDQLTDSKTRTSESLMQPSTPSSSCDVMPTSFLDSITSYESQNSVTTNVSLLDLRGCQYVTDRGLLKLSSLENLESAYFDNCHSLSGRGLLALSNSNRLHTLSLINCRRLHDEGIILVSSCLLSLEVLLLEGCRCLTDRSLAAMSSLTNLAKLDLSLCDLVTDEGLHHLKQLRKLYSLSVGWCRKITDIGLEALTSHPERAENLRVLQLARCTDLTDVGIQYIARLSSLEFLDLNGCNRISSTVTGDTVKKLTKLSVLNISHIPGIIRANWQGKINSLKSLDLRYSGVKDFHLTHFLNLSQLEELCLDSCSVGDNAIIHFADNNVLPNLQALDMADTNLTDAGVSKMCSFTKLKRLSLFYCNITNNSLRYVAKLPNLEVLNLDNRDISDEGLRHLRNMTTLRSLDIFSGRVTDSGCSHISKISSLESLEICGSGISDLGCSLIASLEKLTHLNLSQNERITNRGAAALAILENLRSLNLSHTKVTSSGLRFFSGLRNLQSLAHFGCKGFDEDDNKIVVNLKNTLPNLKCIRSEHVSSLDGLALGENCPFDDMDDVCKMDDVGSECEILWRSQMALDNNGPNGISEDF